MAESLSLKAGFAPYPDGSGHAVTVEVGYEYDGAPASISIECVNRVEVSEWPAVREGIERLMRALPDGDQP